MADYVVPPKRKKRVLVKCWECGALYAPDPNVVSFVGRERYEPCPVCKTPLNSKDNEIPLWKYNLIRYWRGLFNHEQTDVSSTDD